MLVASGHGQGDHGHNDCTGGVDSSRRAKGRGQSRAHHRHHAHRERGVVRQRNGPDELAHADDQHCKDTRAVAISALRLCRPNRNDAVTRR